MDNKKIIKNYIYNTVYQILVLITPLVTTPYVSRVLGVTNIGVFQYCQSIATYFVLIGAVGTTLYGQREIAYLQDEPIGRSKAFWEIEVFRICATILCNVLYLLTICLHGQYPDIYFILSLEVFATAFDISWFFMGMENFKLTVIRNLLIKLTGIICVFLFVKTKNDLGIYTFCVTVPQLFGNLSLWFSIKKNLVKTGLTISELFKGIKDRLKPIFVLFLPQIAMDVYLVLDKTMIGLLASDIDQVGYYSQAQKIVKVVLAIVTSLGTVMLPAMSAFFSRGDFDGIRNSVNKAFRFIYMLSFALLFGLDAIASRFVPIFFGIGYDPVILLMLVISPILVIIAISTVIGRQYLLPTKQQRAFTMSILAGAGVNFLLNLLLIPRWQSVGASIATVAAELAVTGVQCWSVRNQLSLKDCLSSGLRYLLYGSIMFFIVRIIETLIPEGKIWGLGVMICVGIIVYVSELLITKDPMIQMGIDLIRGRKANASESSLLDR